VAVMLMVVLVSISMTFSLFQWVSFAVPPTPAFSAIASPQTCTQNENGNEKKGGVILQIDLSHPLGSG